MGNRVARPQRPEEQAHAPPTFTTAPSSTQQQQQGYAQYPSPAAYTAQQQHYPPYYGPPIGPPTGGALMNNGQYYGGWAPPPPPHAQQQQQQFNSHHSAPAPYPHAPPHTVVPPPPQAPPRRPPPPTQQLTQTATIRNAVNLKKPSLSVTPLPHDPLKLAITFTFDASAPCMVSTFVLATEDTAKGCRLTPAAQPVGPGVAYPKGLGHKFPPPSAAPEVAAAHVVDLTVHADNLEALSAGAGGRSGGSGAQTVFPLVIRLESITERGAKEGRTLADLKPGQDQQPWAQSQTTFATLHREEDGGGWTVRALKQKIWVEGVSYELQEIYGLEQAGGRPGAAPLEDSEERLCVICLVNPRDTTVLPCRHMCLCNECAAELRKQSSRCPICRNHIESLLHIRINRAAEAKEKEKPAGSGTAAGESSSGGA